MKVVAVVLARLGSTRLPGKALRVAHGKPMIEYVFEACRFDGADEVVLATTDSAGDDELAAWAAHRGYPVFRGDEADVSGRFLGALDACKGDAAVRVNGDSPLHRRAMLAEGVLRWRDARPDLVTNVPGRTWPFGLSVEVVSRDAMARTVSSMVTEHHHEHVTAFLCEHRCEFDVHVLPEGSPNFRGVRLSVDDERDFQRFECIVKMLGVRYGSASVSELVDHARAFEDGGRA